MTFLADRAAACSMIGYWHHTVVCLSVHLSVTLSTVAKVSEQMNMKCPP